DIDVQGARQARRSEPRAVTLFVLPPGFEPLRDRLAARGTETAAELAGRLERARQEAEAWAEYDYLIVNDDLDPAVGARRAVVLAERCRSVRTRERAEAILASFRSGGR